MGGRTERTRNDGARREEENVRGGRTHGPPRRLLLQRAVRITRVLQPSSSGVHVVVHVFESSKKLPAPCGSEEKAALAEFAHYGGAEVGKELEAFPLPGKAKGACVTGYPAKGASREQVSAYYKEELSEHGWEVKRRSSSTEASRDGLRYVARYWRNPGSTEVEVQVFKVK